MSLIPEPVPPGIEPGTQKVWPKRLLRVCLALFTFEIGLFLAIFPWSEYWSFNYLQVVIPGLQDVWDQPAFRGALTGLGLVNIYLACLQVVNAFRQS
jgi:hypothetical protein